jgi:hypothetical protein
MVSLQIMLGLVAISLGYMVLFATIAVLRVRRRVLRCPADGKAADVRCDATAAALATFSDRDDEVIGCSRWPARAGCDQRCMKTRMIRTGERS